MSDLRQSEGLLSDVLSESTAADFRAGLLDHTLRLARRRRRFRQARQAASALAVMVAFGLLAWHQSRPSATRVVSPVRCYELVRTSPLPTANWVTTGQLPASAILASVPVANIILTAEASSPVHPLSDDELLSLAPQPAALVRFGPHTAELVCVKQDDTNESLRN